jgi:hypothetical protein
MYKIQNSVALDRNPEPGLVQATGCKQPTLRLAIISLNYRSSLDTWTVV